MREPVPAAECGEGGFTVQPVRVGPGGDQELGGGVGADTVGRPQAGIGLGHDRVDLGLESLGLGFEEVHPLGEHLGGGEHRLRPRLGLRLRAAAGDRLDQLQCR